MTTPRRAHPALVSSLVVLAVLVVASFVAFGLTWRAAADEVLLSRQLPFVISGGLGGLALLGAALGLAYVQVRRWVEADARAELADVTECARQLLLAAGTDQRGLPERARP